MGAERGKRVVRVTRWWDGNDTHRAWPQCTAWDVCFTGWSSGVNVQMNSNNQKMNEWPKSSVKLSVL
jgi:hypothetical protein